MCLGTAESGFINPQGKNRWVGVITHAKVSSRPRQARRQVKDGNAALKKRPGAKKLFFQATILQSGEKNQNSWLVQKRGQAVVCLSLDKLALSKPETPTSEQGWQRLTK